MPKPKRTSHTPESQVARKLREAIAEAIRRGTSLAAIAATAGLPKSQLTRIMHEDLSKRTDAPRLDTVEAIARVIGYKLTLAPQVAK
jgi:DNA-binding phage protein